MDAPPPTKKAKWPTPKELHERRCFHFGITEPEKVARLWEAEKVRLAELKANKGKGNRPHGRDHVRGRRE